MVQITVDTLKDSKVMIKHAIDLLQNALHEHHQDTPQQNVSQQTTTPASGFTDMFGSSEPSTPPPSTQTSEPQAPSNDMFSMFSHELPSSAPNTYGGSADDLIRESVDSDDGEDEPPQPSQDEFRLQQY